MPLQIVRNDITKMKVDAIVNAANSSLLGGGGVDGCIHRAAGPGLLAECKTLGGCETGSAKITKGYKLPCKYVIHAVGPRWRDGKHGEQDKLISCYRTSLVLARENKCETVAFPLISSGIYGYPKDQALRIAIDTISEFLLENDMTVYIVIFDRKAYQISGKLYADIAEYIDDNYVDEHSDNDSVRLRRLNALRDLEPVCEASVCEEADEAIEPILSMPMAAPKKTKSLDEALGQIDESFSELLHKQPETETQKDAYIHELQNAVQVLLDEVRNLDEMVALLRKKQFGSSSEKTPVPIWNGRVTGIAGTGNIIFLNQGIDLYRHDTHLLPSRNAQTHERLQVIVLSLKKEFNLAIWSDLIPHSVHQYSNLKPGSIHYITK